MRYDGGKGITYPHIINLMPPHRRYIETHLGGGAVMRYKLAANEQIGIDIDSKVIRNWNNQSPSLCKLINSDVISVLSDLDLDEETLIYVDPPYHPETRRRKRVYKYDYGVDDHIKLLTLLVTLPCKVLISGYPNKLYDEYLSNWTTYTFLAKTHADVREEIVWFNYPKPVLLHDDRYMGKNFREREVIRKRKNRLQNRISKLTLNEQVSIHKWMSKSLTNKGII